MTFEDSLRKLPEREPEKFLFVFRGDFERPVFYWGPEKREFIELLSQDSLDEILALVGWFYFVTPLNLVEMERIKVKADSWAFLADKRDEEAFIRGEDFYKTKLEAAKAALVAVIEHLEKTSG